MKNRETSLLGRFICSTTAALGAICLAGCGSAASTGSQVANTERIRCLALAKLKTSEYDVTDVSASLVAPANDGPFTVPTTTTTVTSSFCRVTGTAKSNPSSTIRFELWLPLRQAWNGKFLGTASGGSAGNIVYSRLATHFKANYASIAHDNGHVSVRYDQTWAYDPATSSLRTEQIADFTLRAQHVVTVIGKQLTSAFYGSAAKYAYFNGCSQSGHHGMMEVQRYPEDYDGVIAGAHTSDWTTNMASQAWVAYQQFGNKGAGGITKSSYAEVSKYILAKCDGKPGVDHLVDGVLDDPRKCAFDPVELQCSGASTDAPSCLKPAQVAALRAMYQGHKTASGETIAVPYALTAESGASWPNNQTTPTNPQGSWADYIRYPLFVDPGYDFSKFDFDVDPLTARAKLRPIYDASLTDLSAFQRRGGKLLMYHGWSDSQISPFLSIGHWEAIRKTMGASEVEKFARQYLVPGMDHCGGGAGAGDFLMLDALSKWVEQGIPPDGTDADNTIVANGADGRTRPLCPYPLIATYKGAGDARSAGNFSCKAP